jgi:hypothetical protein
MKGLELSEKYFERYGRPMIDEKFSGFRDRVAAGLAGDGSECFGFDDELSMDHDWGPSFCLWLTKDDYQKIGAGLAAELEKLPQSFEGYPPRNVSAFGKNRVGVFAIGFFYRNYIGIDHLPASLGQWMRISENRLAACTNGKVFCDGLGAFTGFRNGLKQFYPEDVRLRKMAARCVSIGQYGQYNFRRCFKRGEYVAASYAQAKFCADMISLIFLLNREYTPFFKWMHKALKKLPVMGEYAHRVIKEIVLVSDSERKYLLIEEICEKVIEVMRQQKLSDSNSDFLIDHGEALRLKIEDPDLRGMSVWSG